jgi:dTMP kinase
VREAFLAMAKANPDHYLVLDARAPVDELHHAIRARIEPLLVQADR